MAPIKATTAWASKMVSSFPCKFVGTGCEELPSGTPSAIFNPSDPHYDDSAVNLLLTAQYLEFTIDPTWKSPTTWTSPAAGPTTLVIDDIVLEFADGASAGTLTAPSFAFTGAGSNKTAVGGSWDSYSDLSSGATGGAVAARAAIQENPRWSLDTSRGEVSLWADLVRSGNNPRGGYAGLSTGKPDGAPMNLTGMNGIRFAIRSAAGSALDTSKVAGVWFKVSKASVGDTATHRILIPAQDVNLGRDILIDPAMLAMPASMQGKPEFKPFSPEDVTRFSWEIRIKDTTGTVTSVPNQGFVVGPVTLYGFSQLPASGVGARVAQARSFAAWYHDGSLSLSGLDDYASLELRSLSGARIANLAPSASVRIRLDRGAYLLVARGDGKPALSRTLVVAR